MYDLSTFGHFKFVFWHGMRRIAFVDFHYSKLKDRYGDGDGEDTLWIGANPQLICSMRRTKTYKL